MQLAENHYRLAVLGACALAMLLLGRMRFCGDFDLPGKPPTPEVNVLDAKKVSASIKRSSEAYKSFLEQDTTTFGIPMVRERVMRAVFPYQADRERRVLKPGETATVLGMSMTLSVEKVRGSKRKHMILSIENKAHKPVAYRVQTRPSSGARSCKRMKHMAHNAVALPAGGRIERSECVYRKGWNLEIVEVETVTLPRLAYLYLSSMPPDGFGLDTRTSRQHLAPKNSMSCRVPSSSTMMNAIKKGTISWHDLVDFYARHRCKTYKFPYSYEAFRKNDSRTLPVTEEDP